MSSGHRDFPGLTSWAGLSLPRFPTTGTGRLSSPASWPQAAIHQRVKNLCCQSAWPGLGHHTQEHMQAHTIHACTCPEPSCWVEQGLRLAKRQTRFLFVFGMSELGSFFCCCCSVFNTPELEASSWPVRSRGERGLFQAHPREQQHLCP